MPQLLLTCFGVFQATLNQTPLVAFESNKARALLAYLAVEATQAHARTTLAGLFWPDFREHNARDNLRHALANLRTLLPQPPVELPFLQTDRQTIQLNPQSSHQLDAADFSQAIARARQPGPNAIATLEAAIKLYRAPFLQGFFLDDCSAFEEWLLLTRERLHNQLLAALYTVAGHFEQQADYGKAEGYARQLLVWDNLQESAHCSLMRILALRGQRSAALSQYEQCRKVLATELGATPSAETVTLHQQIQRGLWATHQLPAIKHPPVAPLLVRSVSPAPPPHNLPAPTNSFVGRRREVADICALLRQPDVRLVTLHGAGGVGKTRLALQAARQLLADCPETCADGCFWVELAPLRDAAQIPMALAQSLGISEKVGYDPLQRLKNHLCDKSILLIIDNFEHLLAAAPLVSELLSQAAQLKCLVTSREPLHVRGEQEFTVLALTLPAPDSPLLAANPTHYEAVQLFIQRAQAVQPNSAVDSASLPVVAEICARLDGLPLVIELAAARCKFFSPRALLQKLETMLTFLRGARDMPDRHQTLRDVIEWSYNLLNVDERKLFHRLAVFVGGFTIEGAAHVCVLEGDGALDVPEMVLSLVDKNLVRQEMVDGAESRFLLLETIREFGLQTIAENDNLFAIQERHAGFYHGLASVLDPQLIEANGVRILAQLRKEYPNLLAALQWLLANRKAELSLQLCNRLLQYWNMVDGREALGYLKAALQLAADYPPTPDFINALVNAGYASFLLDAKGGGQDYFEQCLALNKAAGNVGDPIKIGTANGLLGWIMFDHGDYQAARTYLAAAKENDIAMGADWALAMTLANQGSMEARLGEFEQAHRLLEEALARHRRIGDRSRVASVFLRQSIVYVWQNRFEEAADCVAQSYPICQELQSEGMLADYYSISVLIALHRSEHQQANHFLKEALLIRQKAGVPRYLIEILEKTILIFVGQNRHYIGLAIASTISLYRLKLNLMVPPVEKKLVDDALTRARQQLTPQAAAAAWTIGHSMTLDEAAIYVLAEI